jgi:hypothetical protein
MTHDEVMALSPEELRIKIAEALGWEYKHIQTETEREFFVWQLPNNLWDSLPNWPNDIAAAWGLVQMAGTKHWSVTIENGLHNPQEVLARIFIPNTLRCYTGFGDTAPIAICRAWLLWKAGQ